MPQPHHVNAVRHPLRRPLFRRPVRRGSRGQERHRRLQPQGGLCRVPPAVSKRRRQQKEREGEIAWPAAGLLSQGGGDLRNVQMCADGFLAGDVWLDIFTSWCLPARILYC